MIEDSLHKQTIILKSLPKHSLNEIYAGKHWRSRKKDKDTYKWLIKEQFKDVLSKDNKYKVSYDFHFKNKPLDISNTMYMVKMIEDIIFEDDTYKIIKQLKIRSRKSDKDIVIIKVTHKVA